MKIFLSLMLIVGVLSFSALAQSGANRKSGSTGNQKKNQTQKTTEATNADVEELQRGDVAKDEAGVSEDEVLRVDTNLVTVPVSVSDRDGRFILNLKKEDFQILENGKPQQIAYFAPSEVPFTVALVLDVSYSAHFKIDEIETAAYRFVMNLRPADKVMIVTFDDEYHILTEPTNDRETLRRAVNSARTGGGTALYDTMSYMFDRFAQIPGRKAIVLFTDGVDTTSRSSNDLRNLREAQELDALVYTIHYDTYDDVQNASQMPPAIGRPNPVPGSPVPYPTGQPTIPGTNIPFPMPQRRTTTTRRDPNDPNYPPNYPGRRSPNDPNDPNNQRVILGGGATAAEYRRGREYLAKLSASTGGRLYQADTYGNLGVAYDNIAEELRRQYSIGYYPENEGKAGEERQIKVKVNREKVAVRSKGGYIVGKKKEAAKK